MNYDEKINELQIAIKELAQFTDFRISNLIKRIEELERLQGFGKTTRLVSDQQSALGRQTVDLKPQNSSDDCEESGICSCEVYHCKKRGKLAGLEEALKDSAMAYNLLVFDEKLHERISALKKELG